MKKEGNEERIKEKSNKVMHPEIRKMFFQF